MKRLELTSRTKKAALRRPKELISYSVDVNNQHYIDDARQLRYYYFPDTALNRNPQLGDGQSKFIARDETIDRHLDRMLKTLIYYEKTKNDSKRTKADIITYRGVMTKLMTLPNSLLGNFPPDEIAINAQYFDGQIFLELDHATKLANDAEKNKRMDQQRSATMCYYGYKFESLTTLPKPWTECSRQEIEERNKNVVDNISEYCTIVRTGVGKIKTILGAEVDCIYDFNPNLPFDNSGEENTTKSKPLFDKDGPEDLLSHYVELKTSRIITNNRSASNFNSKLLNTWAQCFLIGTRHVVYGFRDDSGILKAVEEYSTDELPKMVSSSPHQENSRKWSGNDSIEFYASVLEFIKENIPHDDSQIWRIEYKPGYNDIKLYRLDPELEKQRGGIIIQEFKDWRNSLSPE